MNCVQLRLNADTTTIFVRGGWLIVEVGDSHSLQEQLSNATGTRLLSVKEVSQRTGFTAGTVRGWIRRAVVSGVLIGKEYRIREAELAEFMKAGKARNDSAPMKRFGRKRKQVVV